MDLNSGPGGRSHYQTSTGAITNAPADLDRLNQANKEANESILEYINFPDPQLYLIGFETSFKEETNTNSGAGIDALTTSSHARKHTNTSDQYHHHNSDLQ